MSYHAATATLVSTDHRLPLRSHAPAIQATARRQEAGKLDGIARAIATYRQAQPALDADLRADMASRLSALTGSTIAPASIFVEPHTRTAIAVIDQVVFRLTNHELVVVRPCAYCTTGHFTSPAIADATDLGYALAEWDPLHDDCAPEDPRQ